MRNTAVATCAFLLAAAPAVAAIVPAGYHKAPAAIARILEAAPTPAVAVSPDHKSFAILGRENLPTIANLSKPIQVKLTMMIVVINGWNRLTIGFASFEPSYGWKA